MATQRINDFSQFDLTDAEEKAGQTLSTNQLMVLTNLRAEYALKKISLVYTPNDHQTYLQREAEITGWMNCLNYIIECHEIAAIVVTDDNDPDDELQSGSDLVRVFT